MHSVSSSTKNVDTNLFSPEKALSVDTDFGNKVRDEIEALTDSQDTLDADSRGRCVARRIQE